MEWTTTPPTEPGWYWAWGDDVPLPAMVMVTTHHRNPAAGRFMVKRGDTGKYSQLHRWTYWIGPLSVPGSPK